MKFINDNSKLKFSRIRMTLCVIADYVFDKELEKLTIFNERRTSLKSLSWFFPQRESSSVLFKRRRFFYPAKFVREVHLEAKPGLSKNCYERDFSGAIILYLIKKKFLSETQTLSSWFRKLSVIFKSIFLAAIIPATKRMQRRW